jgi:hypothetical protein
VLRESKIGKSNKIGVLLGLEGMIMKAIVTDHFKNKKEAVNIEMESDNRKDLYKWLIFMSKREIESSGYIVNDKVRFCYAACDIQGTGNIDSRIYITKVLPEGEDIEYQNYDIEHQNYNISVG